MHHRSEAPPDRAGREVRRAEVAGLSLVETRFRPDTVLAEHWHGEAFFCLALHGPFHENTRGRTIERRPGGLLFHPPGETHADAFHAPGGACFNIHFSPAWQERLGEVLPVLTKGPVPESGPCAWSAARIRQELLLGPPGALMVEGLVLVLLADGVRGAERLDQWRPPPWIGRVRDYLHDAFREGPSIAEAAALAGVHPVHLARVFRRIFGCTLGEYVRQLRLDCARRLLAESSAPLVAVAAAAGFSDQSHLTRTLKAHHGVTPRQYRLRTRGR